MYKCTLSNVSHENLGNNKELRSSSTRNYEISDKTFLFFSVEFKTSVAAKPASSAGLNALKSGSTPPLTKSASNQQPVGVFQLLLLGCCHLPNFGSKVGIFYKIFISVSAVILRGLDTLSTEDSVLNCLMKLTQMPIKSIKIGKDK